MRDLHNNVKLVTVVGPRAVITGNAVTNGPIIDLQGFESCEFLIETGAITDGTFTPVVTEGNDPALADGAPAAAADLFGAIAPLGAAQSNTTIKLGYKGNKRFVRLGFTQAGATAGGFIAAQAIQGHPRNAPVP